MYKIDANEVFIPPSKFESFWFRYFKFAFFTKKFAIDAAIDDFLLFSQTDKNKLRRMLYLNTIDSFIFLYTNECTRLDKYSFVDMVYYCYDLKMTKRQIEQYLKDNDIDKCRRLLENARVKKTILMVDAKSKKIHVVEPKVVLARTADAEYIESAGTDKTAGFAVKIDGCPHLFGFHDLKELASLAPVGCAEDSNCLSFIKALKSKGYASEELIASLFLTLGSSASYEILSSGGLTVPEYAQALKALFSSRKVNLFMVDPKSDSNAKVLEGSFLYPGPAHYTMRLKEVPVVPKESEKSEVESDVMHYRPSITFWSENQPEFKDTSFISHSFGYRIV
jgi:hypothetical protein